MQIVTWILRAAGIPLLGAIMWASQVPPDDAVSNISKWAEALGFDELSLLLGDKTVDQWIFRSAAILLFVYVIFVIALPLLRSRGFLSTSPRRTKNGNGIYKLNLHVFEGIKLIKDIEFLLQFGGAGSRLVNVDGVVKNSLEWSNEANQIVLRVLGQAATTEFMTILMKVPDVYKTHPAEMYLWILREQISWLESEARALRGRSELSHPKP